MSNLGSLLIVIIFSISSFTGYTIATENYLTSETDLTLEYNIFDQNSLTSSKTPEADVSIDFEGEKPFQGLSMRDVCCNDSLKVVSDPVRSGNTAARFMLRPNHNFSKVGNYYYKTRNEVLPDSKIEEKMNENKISTKGRESWYGFSVRPKEDLYLSSTFEVIFQLHHINDDCDTFGGNPPVAIYVIEDEYIVQNVGDKDRCQKEWNKVNQAGRERWKFPLNRGEWTDWVIHTNWKHTDEGNFEVWRNGEKVIERKGEPVTYNDEKVHFFQFGPYKSPWLNNPRKSNRTYYYDSFRVSGPNGSYEAVAPR